MRSAQTTGTLPIIKDMNKHMPKNNARKQEEKDKKHDALNNFYHKKIPELKVTCYYNQKRQIKKLKAVLSKSKKKHRSLYHYFPNYAQSV